MNIECDKDCSRCTYATCIVDEHRQTNMNAIIKLMKKKKKFSTAAEKSWFEKEYVRPAINLARDY